MLRKEKVSLVVFILLIFWGSMRVALGDNDITGTPEFGCRWTGGSLDNGVTCFCHPSAPEFYIQDGSIPAYDTIRMKIDSCNTVRFGTNAIKNMRNLRNIELSNINNLYFDDFGLSWNTYLQTNNDFYSSWDGTPTLKINIEKSTVKKISSYTFQGRISSIIFRESTVEDVAPFAFSSLVHTQHIEFLNVNFTNVQGQAFKKFPTEFLIISDSTFGELTSRAFSDVIVLNTFQIRNCSFSTIRPAAFLIQNPKRFEVVDSEVNSLDGEGFKVMTRGGVKIKNNIFNTTSSGAFVGISLNKEEVSSEEEILFDSNTFINFGKRSLEINTTSFSAKYVNILINQECNCKFIDYELDEGEFLCLVKEDKKVTLKDFKENNCSVLAGYTTIIIVLGVVLVLFLIIFSSLLFYFKRVYKKHREYITDKNGKPVSLIMPDGRTYRETELHVVVERADLLTTDL